MARWFNGRRFLLPFVLGAALGAAPTLAQADDLAQETQQGRESPEGGAYGSGADVHEQEAHGIVNWWSWDRGPEAKNPAHRDWPAPFGFALINFGIFLAIMWKLAGKSLIAFVQQRHDSISKNLDDAASLRQQAEATLKQYQAKIAGLDQEIDTLLATIRQEAEKEKARIMAAAEADAKRLKQEAERQIAAEIDAARRELRRGVIEAAITAASETVRQKISATDQKRMAEEYVTGLEGQTKSGRPS